MMVQYSKNCPSKNFDFLTVANAYPSEIILLNRRCSIGAVISSIFMSPNTGYNVFLALLKHRSNVRGETDGRLNVISHSCINVRKVSFLIALQPMVGLSALTASIFIVTSDFVFP